VRPRAGLSAISTRCDTILRVEMSGKTEHLQMNQQVINRMASNSFVLKGWSVTITSALLALAAKDAERRFVLLACFPLVMFWALDGYYLLQERLFRERYDQVRRAGEDTDFSMETGAGSMRVVTAWLGASASITLGIFHGCIGLAILVTWLLVGQPAK
jgi:hypothetical protein